MKPKVKELWLPDANHQALLKEMKRLSATQLLPAWDDRDMANSLLNTPSVSLFLGSVVDRHLTPEIRAALSQIGKEQNPPIIVIGNLPCNTSLRAEKVKSIKSISEYMLCGMAALLDHDPSLPLQQAKRKKTDINSVSEESGPSGRGQGYHRDGLAVKAARREGKPYSKMSNQYSMLLCERENIHAATFFVEDDNPHIDYYQDVKATDMLSPVDARPVVLMAGQLCVFRNNELIHGRIATAKKDQDHLRRLKTAVVTVKDSALFSSPDNQSPQSLEDGFRAAVEAGIKERSSAIVR